VRSVRRDRRGALPYSDAVSEPEDALAQAPLLRVVHERHPDVDLVVLPPEPPAPDAATAPVPVTDAALDAEREQVDAVLAGLLAAADAGDAGAAGTWRMSRAGHVVPVAEARVPAAGAEAGTAVARALSGRLRTDGWEGRIEAAGPAPRLQAGRDGRSVRVVWLDDAVLVTVRGRDLPVATATARGLVSGNEEDR
jgi:hypothetical protein